MENPFSAVALLVTTSNRVSFRLEVLNENHNSGKSSIRTANKFFLKFAPKLWFFYRTALWMHNINLLNPNEGASETTATLVVTARTQTKSVPTATNLTASWRFAARRIAARPIPAAKTGAA